MRIGDFHKRRRYKRFNGGAGIKRPFSTLTPTTIDKDEKGRERIKNASFDTTSFMDDPILCSVAWLGLLLLHSACVKNVKNLNKMFSNNKILQLGQITIRSVPSQETTYIFLKS